MENVKRKFRIIVVGGGFAGINFIKRIAPSSYFEVILVDKNNYHFFPPLLYQVAASLIEPSNICYPFRRLFQRKKNLRFHMGSLLKIIPDQNSIETDTGTLAYDYLVIATGTIPNYFGMENIKKNALTLKTISDALHLRNHILLSIEKAIRTNLSAEKQKYLNIVIAGGGPTGVEIAGVIAEMRNYLAAKEYPEVKGQYSKIYLVDFAPVLLGTMTQAAQKEAEKVITKLGVDVILNAAVKDYVDGRVLLGNGKEILTNTLIWTSGVTCRIIEGIPAESIGKGNRIMTDEYNLVKGMKNIFVLGDIALQTSDPNYPNGHPQVAQVAIQQAHLLANNLVRMVEKKPLESFQYKDKGSMAIISKYKAVADLPKFSFKGYFAWVIWLFIHLIPIAGFSNKVKLAYNWFWAFISNNPALRLIIRGSKIP